MTKTSKSQAREGAPDFAVGASLTVTFEANKTRANGQQGAVKANSAGGVKTRKIILIDTKAHAASRLPMPKPGETWVCRVERITNPGSKTNGAILVRPVSRETSFDFKDVYVPTDIAKLMTVVLQNRLKNLFLEGDQGIGKSTIAAAVARTLGWEFRKVSGGLIKKFNYMLGRLMPTVGAGGAMQMLWVDSKLTAVLREANRPENKHKTFLLMIDEFTRIDEDARDALLDVIEGQNRSLQLPNGEEVPVPENVHFMAAGNAGQGFTVRQEDAAAKDRWVIVKLKHMPHDVELKHCLRRFPDCPAKEMDLALNIVNHVRAARLDPKRMLSKAPSTRVSENIAMFLSAGVELKVALENAVTNQYSGRADDINTEAGKVAKLIEERLKNPKDGAK
ncbi:MAG TPA: MoxR family ATPase [Candidatus Obscuribacter sp.]|nr:MoxR family ATPase [Candidatus Obscuribacter sp.]HMY54516.1 MoxR family ATPase [Candidatus Obscuribacter sp.]HNB14382.1 MoxR family ATPase [Candidatus Obscuribacter sp.]HND65747.1 MoxR family ATPase [Candidatus Obscuribacter sp.]HNG73097.1 MoxR family ATPase [Candidatus Obscuribacter sp.]